MDFWRVRCSKCGKTFASLAKLIGLERYQTKSNELEKLVVEAASGTNYRRAVKDLERDGKLPVSFHTAHGWVMRSDCDESKISLQTVGSAPIQIMPDGTGFKGASIDGHARKGDLKVVIGISQQGNIFPLTSKAGATWKDITDEWDRNKIKFNDGSILIASGSVRNFATAEELDRFIKLNYPDSALPEMVELEKFYKLMWQAIEKIKQTDPQKIAY